MATFYKYAERQAGDYVNWAEIGKNATDMITEETKIREEKKAAIDEEARQLFLKLAEPPTGVSDTAQKKAIEFSDIAQKQKLNDLRLLKSGKLSLKDYLVRSQNLSDGTGIAFNLIKEYQEEFKVKMDRMNSADPKTRSQAVEGVAMSSVEGFAKLESMDFLIDPNQGIVQLGMKKLNPQTGVYEFTNEILPTVHARARIKTNYDYFDSDAATNDIEKQLGESVKVIRKLGSASRTGQVLSYEDKKELENYKDAEKLFIESYLSSNPLNMSSVLTNDMKGQGYVAVLTKEEAAKNPKAVYFKTNSNGVLTPEFTDKQKEEAFKYMQTTLRGKIDRKETSNMYTESTPRAPQQWEKESAENQKKIVGTAQLVGALYGGDSAEIKTSLGSLRDINPNIKKIRRTKEKSEVTVLGPDGKTVRIVPLPFYGVDVNGKRYRLSQQQFIMQAAPLLAGNADWKTALERGGYNKKYDRFNNAVEDEASIQEVQEQAPSGFGIFGGGMNLPNPTAAPVPSTEAPTE